MENGTITVSTAGHIISNYIGKAGSLGTDKFDYKDNSIKPGIGISGNQDTVWFCITPLSNNSKDTSTNTNLIVTTTNQGVDNRLVTLLNTKILPATRATDTSSTSNLENLQRLGISRTNKNLLFSYPGGPGSVYGIGLTTIPRYADNSDLLRTNPASSLYKNQEGETTTLADIYVLTKEGLKSTKAAYISLNSFTLIIIHVPKNLSQM